MVDIEDMSVGISMADGMEFCSIDNLNMVIGSSQKLMAIDDVPLDQPVAEKDVFNPNNETKSIS